MSRAGGLAGLLAVAFLIAAAGGRQDVFRYDAASVILETEADAGEALDDGLARLEESLRRARSSVGDEEIEAWLARREKGGYVGSFDSAGPWLVWDEFDPETRSFDVLARRFDHDEAPVLVLAGGPEFQARPVARLSADEVLWVAWEEGPEGYGSVHRSVDKLWNNATDDDGPLHSWRAVRLAAVDSRGRAVRVPVPMPSFEVASDGEGRRAGAERLGVFYERPALALEPSGALVLGLRHMHQHQLALTAPTKTHVEKGFAVDVLRLSGAEWSAVSRLDELQRSGNQRLVLRPGARATHVLAEAGRRDRRTAREASRALPRVVRATLPRDRADAPPERKGDGSKVEEADPRAALARTHRTAEVGGVEYTLLFGDLHRHTDLSLCFPFYDGSLDDAYRYARGPGALDFVAITDHARDLGRGDVDSLPWRLTVEAADRHHRPGEFVAFYSYERSQANTDHNVIGLRDDILRPHTPPLSEFWDAWRGEDVLTIPHATGGIPARRFTGDVWQKSDERLRPLAEVYQSYRDVDSLEELQRAAFAEGQRLGLIASSDHLSTSGAYACVWTKGAPAEALDRRPIFDALRSRRTYGATDRIELEVRSGAAWMGEELAGPGPYPITVRVSGADEIAEVTFWADGAVAHEVSGGGRDELECTWSWPGPAEDRPGWCLVTVEQSNGERAWASPFFTRR